MPLSKLVELGIFPRLVMDMLVDLIVKGHANLGVFGGKTTIIRACGETFDPDEKVMIGETSFELSFPHLPNC